MGAASKGKIIFRVMVKMGENPIEKDVSRVNGRLRAFSLSVSLHLLRLLLPFSTLSVCLSVFLSFCLSVFLSVSIAHSLTHTCLVLVSPVLFYMTGICKAAYCWHLTAVPLDMIMPPDGLMVSGSFAFRQSS